MYKVDLELALDELALYLVKILLHEECLYIEGHYSPSGYLSVGPYIEWVSAFGCGSPVVTGRYT